MLGLFAKSRLDSVQLYPLGFKFSVPEYFSFQVPVQRAAARGTRSWGSQTPQDLLGGCCPSPADEALERELTFPSCISSSNERKLLWPALRKQTPVIPVESCHVASLRNRDLECCLFLSPGKSVEIWLVALKNS